MELGVIVFQTDAIFTTPRGSPFYSMPGRGGTPVTIGVASNHEACGFNQAS